ncbi:excalibur calcium-binding domain-containing protein [Panacagrimonas sp.]|uniref:excalibur calcium-binding domain-containing protein n=1 Tax=Panacagrimonas sp. TaxID=2480088 RepID=UPI003B5288D7
MKNVLLLVLITAIGWGAYDHFQDRSEDGNDAEDTYLEAAFEDQPVYTESTNEQYACDGRTHCSHMRSCEEATYFIHNCPGTQMDGDNDGVPCESQWCR